MDGRVTNEAPERVVVINLTPHEVVVLSTEGSVLARFDASGAVARCQVTAIPAGTIGDGIRFRRIHFGELVDPLPPAEPGVVYLVSVLTAQNSERADLVVIDEEVRDAAGRVIGCRGLARLDHATAASRVSPA